MRQPMYHAYNNKNDLQSIKEWEEEYFQEQYRIKLELEEQEEEKEQERINKNKQR